MPEPSQTIRAFLAVRLPPDVLAQLEALQRTLGEVIDDVSWTRAESLHLTICFFGNVSVERLTELQMAI